MVSKRVCGNYGVCCVLAACAGWLMLAASATAGTIDEEKQPVQSEELQPVPGPAEDQPPAPHDGPPGLRGGDRFGAAGFRAWRGMSEEDRQAMIAFMAKHFPERFDELADVEAEDGELYKRYIGRVLPQMMRLRELEQEDPEAFEVQIATMKKEFQLRRLARRYRFASDDEKKTELEGEIRTLVGDLFDLKGRQERLELARLEKRLDHLRERVEQRDAHRDDHIEHMVADILSGKPPRDGEGRRGDEEGERPRFNAVPEGTAPAEDQPARERHPKRGTR